jgi:hypothetical protein
MVSEGDLLEPALRVERIEVERILLDAAGETLVLELNFRGGPAAVAAGPEAAPGALATAPETLDSTPYGIRISDHRWVLQRDSLLKYYEGLRDDPERIAQLYETFKPLVEQDRITGYRLGIEGEKEFLSAMGLQENDVIRTVNSMDMVSQGRAEFFVREFVQGRMSAVVLEVERDNVRSKKIYEIR